MPISCETSQITVHWTRGLEIWSSLKLIILIIQVDPISMIFVHIEISGIQQYSFLASLINSLLQWSLAYKTLKNLFNLVICMFPHKALIDVVHTPFQNLLYPKHRHFAFIVVVYNSKNRLQHHQLIFSSGWFNYWTKQLWLEWKPANFAAYTNHMYCRKEGIKTPCKFNCINKIVIAALKIQFFVFGKHYGSIFFITSLNLDILHAKLFSSKIEHSWDNSLRPPQRVFFQEIVFHIVSSTYILFEPWKIESGHIFRCKTLQARHSNVAHWYTGS